MQCLLHAVNKLQSVEGSTVQCVNWQYILSVLAHIAS
jgi:hypothetical protein